MNRNWIWITTTFVLFSSALQATAAPWFEVGDAGDLPGTAQRIVGSGPLTDIFGEIPAGPQDRDMFMIRISDPAAFSASTVVGTKVVDTQLFVFDAAGFGVLANDDDPSGGIFERRARIPAGHFSGPVGTYLIAISRHDRDPANSLGEIFPDRPFRRVHGPTGPGGGSPITFWNREFFNSSGGRAYRIQLTGASFLSGTSAVPEPATVALVPFGLIALAGYGWRRRKAK